MNKHPHKADDRGVAEHGWLSSRHSFSFAGYYDPDKMGFGLLRVINDDTVQASMGFGTHPHENMEIISIPLKGSLRHADSMGNVQDIKAGEVQIMSAGSGITHSEFNGSDTDAVNFLQIWVLPKQQDTPPGYDQKLFLADERQGQLQNVVSPNEDDGGVFINQDAWFWLGDYKAGQSATYDVQRDGNGVYFFVLEGSVTVADEQLNRRDAIGVEKVNRVSFTVTEDCQLLVIDVPMGLT